MSTKIVGTLGVRLTAVSAEFTKGLDKARVRLEKFSTTARRAATAGSATFASLAVPLAVSIKLASSMDEKMNILSVSFGKATPEVLKWSKTTARAVGVSEGKMQDFAGSMQAMLLSLVGSKEAAKRMSLPLSKLAVDLGSMHEMAPEEALERLRAGLMGSAEPLLGINVAMSVLELQAFATSRGIDKTVASMSTAEKVQLRYAFIMEKTRDAQGDAEKTSHSFANTVKAITAALTDFSAGIGASLLPIATKVAWVLRELAVELADLSPETKKIIAHIGVFATALAGLTAGIGLLGLVLPSVIAGLGVMGSAFTAVLLPIAAIAAAIGGVIMFIGAMRKAWEGDLFGMRSYLTKFATSVGSVGESIVGAFSWVGESIVGIWDKVTEAIGKLWDIAFDWVSKKFDQFVGGIARALSWLQETGIIAASFVLGETPEMAKKTADEAKKGGGLLGGGAGAASDVAKAAAEAAEHAAKTVLTANADALTAMKKATGKYIDKLAFNLSELGGNIGTTAKEVFTRFGSDLEEAFGGGVDVIPGGSDITTKIRESIKETLDYVAKIIKGMKPPKPKSKTPPPGIPGLDEAEKKKKEEAEKKKKEEAAIAAALKKDEWKGGVRKDLVSSTGAAGEVAGGAMEGASAAGPIGALIGALVTLLKKTKFFSGIIVVLNAAINTMVMALDDLLKPLRPLLKSIMKTFVVFGSMAMAVNVFGNRTEAMAEILGWVAEQLDNFIGYLVARWNEWIERLASLIEDIPFVGKMAKHLRKMKQDAVKDQMSDYEEAFGESLGEVFGTAKDAAEEFGESLTNVPAGFKTALARFNATDPNDAVGAALGAGAGASNTSNTSSKTVTNNNEYNFNGITDPREIYQKIRELQEMEDFMNSGTTVRAGSDLSVVQPR